MSPAGRGVVTPNRRGAASREAVLDAAERVMATKGYEAASVAAIVAESGVPMSSVYHYYGSKQGVLLAVLERGAARLMAALPVWAERRGTAAEHLAAVFEELGRAIDENPGFLRLLIAIEVLPGSGDEATREVVTRLRGIANQKLVEQLALAFGDAPDDPRLAALSGFAVAVIDGSFAASLSDPDLDFHDQLARIPTALVALHEVAASGRNQV